MEKDEFLLKRIRELAKLSYQRDIVTFSDFLNLNEQNMVHSQKLQELGVIVEFYGGYENAERQMVAFHPDALMFQWEYPVDCIRITPKALKFSEELTHRDYLGAILNLGVDRSVVGDILVDGNTAWFFCLSKMTGFFLEKSVQSTAYYCSGREGRGSGIDAKGTFPGNPGNLFLSTSGYADRSCFWSIPQQHGFLYRGRPCFCKWQADHIQRT